jgi:hypothetical protein
MKDPFFEEIDWDALEAKLIDPPDVLVISKADLNVEKQS